MGREVFDSNGRRQGFEGYITVLHLNVNPAKIELVKTTNGALFAWFSQPALAAADVDGDGKDEVFVGTADGKLFRIDEIGGGNYDVIQLTSLDSLWPQERYSTPASAIAVANIYPDAGNNYEVVAVSTDGSNGPAYKVYCIDTETGEIHWTFTLTASSLYYTKFTWPTIALGDIDGDSSLEILASAFNYLSCIDE